jgi:hypothetical protein
MDQNNYLKLGRKSVNIPQFTTSFPYLWYILCVKIIIKLLHFYLNLEIEFLGYNANDYIKINRHDSVQIYYTTHGVWNIVRGLEMSQNYEN